MTPPRRKSPPLSRLEKRLGRPFARRELLEEALTHVSAAGPAQSDNQRLEFLGDRVLGLVIAEALLERRPQESEGTLAPRLNALVRKETCAAVAESLDIGAHLTMARAEAASGGRRKSALLADAMEAVIAAVYLDGGFEAARAFILAQWGSRLEAQGAAPIDAKTALQEWAQGRGRPLPAYGLVSREGPDHAPLFRVSVALSDGRSAIGEANSKRGAEQMAAAALLARIEAETEDANANE
ncbi:MAG: ribonuclease III [Pseudomonadota bacterium]